MTERNGGCKNNGGGDRVDSRVYGEEESVMEKYGQGRKQDNRGYQPVGLAVKSDVKKQRTADSGARSEET